MIRSIMVGILGLTLASHLLAQPHMIVVVGAEGEPMYGEQFDSWSQQWRQLCEKANAELTMIGGSSRVDNADDSSDREKLQQQLAKLSKSDSSSVWIVLIGHGTFLKDQANFNLVGPDVSAKDLSEWLKQIPVPTVVVNGASASGPFINALSAKDRVVITATKSGLEDNFARFAGFFSAALASPTADLDHDDEVSLLEAFLKAAGEVEQFYASEARISTEHALVDDNADALGTPADMFEGVYAKSPKDVLKQADGRLAAQTVLIPSKNRLPFSPEELQRRAAIERELDQLRVQRKTLSSEQYDQRLEQILLPLSQLYHDVERRVTNKQ